jgi:hypothetical protein
MRTFTTQSGRTWSATLYYFPLPSDVIPKGAHGPVSLSALRFTSDGNVCLELVEWPSNWIGRSDAELTELLRRAQPPSLSAALLASGAFTRAS